jgi:hypothetical protein
MTKNEYELLTIISEDKNPREAAMIAIGIIFDYLKQPLSYREASADPLQELA